MQGIESLSETIAAWHAQLPPILSGAIQPSSLIPLFRHQLTVLQLARFHAVMFVTRPLLLRKYATSLPGCENSYRHYLTTCVAAARDTVSLILRFAKEEQLFPAFWYSQYLAFNALSAIYIYLIQMKRGRIPPCTAQGLHENVLCDLRDNSTPSGAGHGPQCPFLAIQCHPARSSRRGQSRVIPERQSG